MRELLCCRYYRFGKTLLLIQWNKGRINTDSHVEDDCGPITQRIINFIVSMRHNSIVSVADELSGRLAPSLSDLNSKLPKLEKDTERFTNYMTDLADEISSYTDSMGSITWSSIVNGFQKIFTGNPIADLADDVETIRNDTISLNAELETANPELEDAIDLLTNYNSLMTRLKLITEKNGDIELATQMFTNLKEVGKQLVTGLNSGITENMSLVTTSMSTIVVHRAASLSATQHTTMMAQYPGDTASIIRKVTTWPLVWVPYSCFQYRNF